MAVFAVHLLFLCVLYTTKSALVGSSEIKRQCIYTGLMTTHSREESEEMSFMRESAAEDRLDFSGVQKGRFSKLPTSEEKSKTRTEPHVLTGDRYRPVHAVAYVLTLAQQLFWCR